MSKSQEGTGLPAGPVENEDIIEAALHFTEFMKREYPQEKDGELKLFPVGSLSYPVYAEADKLKKLDSDQLPDIEVEEQVDLPERTRELFREMSRAVGDFDYVRLPETSASETPGKGGGGPAHEDITPLPDRPMEAHPALGLKRGEEKLPFMDPFGQESPEVFQAEIDGETFYAPSLKHTLKYKTLHFIERYRPEPENKRDEMKNRDLNRELPMILEAVTEVYDREEIVEEVYGALLESEISSLELELDSIERAKKDVEEKSQELEEVRREYEEGEAKAYHVERKEELLENAENWYEEKKEGDFYSDNLKWISGVLNRGDIDERAEEFLWDVFKVDPSAFHREARKRGIGYRPELPEPEDYDSVESFVSDIDEAFQEYHSH